MEISLHADDCPADAAGRIAEAEEKHFWFSARADLIRETLSQRLGPLSNRSVLDIGCGTGYVLANLERAGMTVTGCDMHESWLDFARQRVKGKLVCVDATTLSGDDYDSALLCDVIEHTPDDVGLLEIARNTVRPGGVVLVTVPAHQQLWTVLDDVAGHKRRYSRGQLKQAMARAGLVDLQARYFNHSLLPFYLARKIQLRKVTGEEAVTKAALSVPPSWINSALGWVMRAETALPGGLLGASIIATGRAP